MAKIQNHTFLTNTLFQNTAHPVNGIYQHPGTSSNNTGLAVDSGEFH